MECPLCIGYRWRQPISTKLFNVVNLACDVAQLQHASLVEHEEFFCVTYLLSPQKQSITLEVFDVYMEPLVEDLPELGTSIAAYDVTKPVGFYAFILHVVLQWTIHDFLGYGIIGGFSHLGYAGYPWCGPKLGMKHFVELGK